MRVRGGVGGKARIGVGSKSDSKVSLQGRYGVTVLSSHFLSLGYLYTGCLYLMHFFVHN